MRCKTRLCCASVYSAQCRHAGVSGLLFYTVEWSAVYYLVSLFVGILAAGLAYKGGKGRGFMHFMGIIAGFPGCA